MLRFALVRGRKAVKIKNNLTGLIRGGFDIATIRYTRCHHVIFIDLTEARVLLSAKMLIEERNMETDG